MRKIQQMLNQGRRTPFDYLFLLRPTLLVPVWTFLLLGYYWGSRVDSESGLWKLEDGITFIKGLFSSINFNFQISNFQSPFLWAFLLYSCLMGGVYILNQIADRETDRINQKLFLLSLGIIPLSFAYLEMGILFACALLLSFFIFQFSFFSGFVLLSLLVGILYSFPPLKLKGRPFMDLLSNSIGFGFINFSTGWLTIAPFSHATVFHSIPYVLSVGAVFLYTTLPDIEGDEKAGDRTTGVLLGRRKSGFLGVILLLSALLSSLSIGDPFCMTVAILALPLFLLGIWKDEMRFYLLSIRISAPLLVLWTAVLFPLFFILLGITLLSMRIYYQKRFGFPYPSIFS